jgi:hypothetical protein
MTTVDERREAARLLSGLENGTLSSTEAPIVAEDLDPVLVYVIINFLRAVHPASDPAATPVLERVVRLTSGHLGVLRKYGEGEQDPISRWFESEYEYRDYRGRESELIELIVDKIET